MNVVWNVLQACCLSLLTTVCVAQFSELETSGESLAHLTTSKPVAELPANTQRIAITVGMERQLFPSYILATATRADKNDGYTLGDVANQITVSVHNPAANTPVRVEVSATPFSEAALFEGTMSEASREYKISPRLPWNFQKLRNLLQPTPINFTVTTYVNHEKVAHRTIVANLRSVNDCPYYWEETGNPDNSNLDLNYMYVAYVNEDDPVIDEVLAQALQGGIVEAFDGYQTSDKKQVDEQVFSLWYTLQRHGIRYSSISTNSSTGISETLYSQRVRLINETWQNRQANCVDAMVLMASLLRSIHIDPVLVLLPDHCFLGYYRDADHKELICLETSMIGDGNLKRAIRREKVSRKLFNDARQRAQRQYRDAKDFFEKDARYQFVVVADVRKSGVRPIGR